MMNVVVGDVPLKRGFGPSAIEAMARGRKALESRVSVMIFPDGTARSCELLAFKYGAFRRRSRLEFHSTAGGIGPSTRFEAHWRLESPSPRSGFAGVETDVLQFADFRAKNGC